MKAPGAYVGFHVGGVPLAVEAGDVRGIARAAGIIQVPFARACVAGVVVREGRLVPVLDLARVPAVWNEVPAGAGDQIVVLRAGEIEAGFLVEDAETIATGSPDHDAGASPDTGDAARPPAPVREAVLRGALSARGKTYGILRVDAAISAAGLTVS